MADSWKSIARGMHVQVKGEDGVWTVLDRHPDKGYWWLHRWSGDKWETTHAHYSALLQILVKVC